MNQFEHALHTLQRGAVQVLPQEEINAKIRSGKKLIIKLGMDPTAPDLHLGHTIVLKKLKELQELGHTIILIIGDFTAAIGDPTGRSKTRPPLSPEVIQKNTQTYLEQVSKVIDPSKLTIRYNSEWLGTLTAHDWVKLCASVTLARLTEREDFANRIANHIPVGFHELLYPLMQGYDSVVLKADVEIGGTDQTFNLLMGRFLQEHYGQEPQVVITMPLLEGLDGSVKMSKSLGNALGLTEPAEQAFGKLMSITDALMWHYAALLLNKTPQEISHMQEQVSSGTLHPMVCKKSIAHAIVRDFWSIQEADHAQQQFEALFQKKDYSKADAVRLPSTLGNPVWIIDLLKALKAIDSSSQARRLIESGAVSINDEPVKDFKHEVQWRSGTTVKVGKHKIYRIE